MLNAYQRAKQLKHVSTNATHVLNVLESETQLIYIYIYMSTRERNLNDAKTYEQVKTMYASKSRQDM